MSKRVINLNLRHEFYKKYLKNIDFKLENLPWDEVYNPIRINVRQKIDKLCKRK